MSAQTDLSGALNGKSATGHGHAPGDIAGTAVVDNDSRLTNARPPITHAHSPTDTTGTAVINNDARLTNARTPTEHAHAPGDVTGTAVIDNDSRLTNDRVPTSHDNTKHSASYIVQANAVVPNTAITGASKTKITYDAKGLVTEGADASTADIGDSTDKRYCTDAQKTVIGNTTNTNSGDQTLPVKATGTEINTGTDDAKFATAKAIKDSDVAFLADIPAPVTDATIATTDVPTNNASITKHGWFPKLPTASGKYLKDDLSWAVPAAAPASNPWDGLIVAARGDGNPQQVLHSMQRAGNISPTPTGITITVARIAYFRLPANLTVNKIRYFGVGAITNVYRVAIYNGDTLDRLTAELPFTTALSAWGAAGAALNLTLTAGQLYFIAVAVNATGTTPGVLAYGTTVAATTGMMAVLPKDWPGNLDIDLLAIPATAHAQFTVATGALPTPAATIAVQSAWAGGMPAFFLDNSNL